MVECLLAKEEVASSNLVFRSIYFNGDVAKWLRQGSAKPLFSGSNPLVASIITSIGRDGGIGRRRGLKILRPKTLVGSRPSPGTNV